MWPADLWPAVGLRRSAILNLPPSTTVGQLCCRLLPDSCLQIVLGGDGSLMHRSGAGTPGVGGDEDDDTLPVAHRPEPAAEEADADATRPLARPAAPAATRAASPPRPRPAGPRVQIDGAGNVAVMRPSSAGVKPLPVPPPPPPALAEAVPAAPAVPRVPMGPPPPKQARPAAAAVPAAVPQQQQARPGRRVVEDENTVTVKVRPGRVCARLWDRTKVLDAPRAASSASMYACGPETGCPTRHVYQLFFAMRVPPHLQDIVYTKLECVGRGGSSKVYKVMAPNRKIFALKRIRLQVGWGGDSAWSCAWMRKRGYLAWRRMQTRENLACKAFLPRLHGSRGIGSAAT